MLPQLAGRPFITDGGMETTLIFHEGIDLPDFAAFVLPGRRRGTRRRCAPTSRRYIDDRPRSAASASCSTRRRGAPTPIGASGSATRADGSPTSNRRGVALAGGAPGTEAGPALPHRDPRLHRAARRRLPRRSEHDRRTRPRTYHAPQIATFVGTARGPGERAHAHLCRRGDRHRARRAGGGDPGRDLVHGRNRRPAAQRRSRSAKRSRRSTQQTGGAAAYFMINCAHPTHFDARPRRGRALASTAFAVSGPTRRRRATPSSTRPRSSTRAIPRSSAAATASCASGCRT